MIDQNGYYCIMHSVLADKIFQVEKFLYYSSNQYANSIFTLLKPSLYGIYSLKYLRAVVKTESPGTSYTTCLRGAAWENQYVNEKRMPIQKMCYHITLLLNQYYSIFEIINKLYNQKEVKCLGLMNPT